MTAMKSGRLQVILLLGLILSLGLNIFMFSYVFGQKRALETLQADMLSLQIASDDHRDQGDEEGREHSKRGKRFVEVAQMLTPEGREVVTQSFAPVLDEARTLHEELSQARQALSDLSGSEDFTERKYMAAMRDMEIKQTRIKKLMRRAVVRAMVRLSPDDRKIIAKHHKKMVRSEIRGFREE